MFKHSFALIAGALTIVAPHAQAADADNETIIITGRADPKDPPIVAEARDRLARTPGAVAVVSNEMLEERTAQGLPDMLRDIPGVVSQKRYGEESRLSIRGSGIGQSFHQRGVLLAQDGVPFADADGFSDFQKLDALSARYVEVYKGGNALRFGGAQLGGAINVVTPNGRTAQSRNMLRLEGGSFDTLRAGAQLARESGAWDGFVSLSGLQASGYRLQSEQSQARFSGNAGYSFGEDRELRLYVVGANIAQDVPGTLTLAQAEANPRQASAVALANRWARDQEIGRLSLQTRWRFDDTLVFEGGVYGTSMNLHHPISIVIDQQTQNRGAFGRFDWTGDLGGNKADLYVGASYRSGGLDQQIHANVGGGSGAQSGDVRQEGSGLDVFAEGRYFVIDHLALVAGASYGRATRDYGNLLNAANNGSKDFEWFAPRVGVLWQADDGPQIYANVTRSVEPPHFGALVQAPNPGFVPVEPQEAWTGEIGTRGKSGAFTWDVTLYRAEIENELLSFAQFGLPSAVANADKTIHQGVEVALDWRINNNWLLRQSYTFSDFKFDGDASYGDNRLPVVPEHQYRGALRYESGGIFIEPSIEWRASDVFVDYNNTTKAPGFALLHLNAGYDFENGARLFLDARNLTDENYIGEFGAVITATPATATFYPGESRAAFVGVARRF